MPRRIPKSIKRSSRAKPPTPYIPKQVKFPLSKKAQAKPTPKGPSYSERIFNKLQESIEGDGPHFPVGGREVYFPHAKVVLVRPSAKHTPYQAKFVVPRYFNKLDLRDYLYHVYGLKALNITTQLLWARWKRDAPGKPRYRTPQVKKMTIEMADPFVWPKPTTLQEIRKHYNVNFIKELHKYGEDANRFGSDKLKPPRAFGGIAGPYVPPASPFLPKQITRQMLKKKKVAEVQALRQKDVDMVKNFLRL
ncbi:mitochondrial 54S ribosomal protein YmL41 [Sugiyamaella lignohabitans]|uniref:Large ribosomal subunit protein uL23m n=1 Tax=Sugiyamaella lignohabitans TaxID=796027 RepID=A0A167EB71_9ASCO|nr:mitochondrial 54S ribosomal protein YmL41 [Sugiyamaella lignohabitans]ANB13860.1 mitochondrial 54S ribosomal protein YmL41 [Sugiyamaella lignohabitans]